MTFSSPFLQAPPHSPFPSPSFSTLPIPQSLSEHASPRLVNSYTLSSCHHPSHPLITPFSPPTHPKITFSFHFSVTLRSRPSHHPVTLKSLPHPSHFSVTLRSRPSHHPVTLKSLPRLPTSPSPLDHTPPPITLRSRPSTTQSPLKSLLTLPTSQSPLDPSTPRHPALSPSLPPPACLHSKHTSLSRILLSSSLASSRFGESCFFPTFSPSLSLPLHYFSLLLPLSLSPISLSLSITSSPSTTSPLYPSPSPSFHYFLPFPPLFPPFPSSPSPLCPHLSLPLHYFLSFLLFPLSPTSSLPHPFSSPLHYFLPSSPSLSSLLLSPSPSFHYFLPFLLFPLPILPSPESGLSSSLSLPPISPLSPLLSPSPLSLSFSITSSPFLHFPPLTPSPSFHYSSPSSSFPSPSSPSPASSLSPLSLSLSITSSPSSRFPSLPLPLHYSPSSPSSTSPLSLSPLSPLPLSIISTPSSSFPSPSSPPPESGLSPLTLPFLPFTPHTSPKRCAIYLLTYNDHEPINSPACKIPNAQLLLILSEERLKTSLGISRSTTKPSSQHPHAPSSPSSRTLSIV
ncbi:hypothetical protein C7M84_011887 [Penaeus vannamei]|uniref:Uncharacterized protein n=1 Tax=Penaeus vannamei TaxID=6689 RepID=A0A3R7Q6M7_PENVA|nr:hypothetical protein C7M84_011887 [Penaeus vannamei]